MIMTSKRDAFARSDARRTSEQVAAVQRAENEGMPPSGAHRDRLPPEVISGRAQTGPAPRPRFEIEPHHGIWRVTKDGNFFGDYLAEVAAKDAVGLQTAGEAADPSLRL